MMPMLAADAASGHRSRPSSVTVLIRWSEEVSTSASGYCCGQEGDGRAGEMGRLATDLSSAGEGSPSSHTAAAPRRPLLQPSNRQPARSAHLLHVRDGVAQPHCVHIRDEDIKTHFGEGIDEVDLVRVNDKEARRGRSGCCLRVPDAGGACAALQCSSPPAPGPGPRPWPPVASPPVASPTFSRPILWKVGEPQPKSSRVRPEAMEKAGTFFSSKNSSSLSSIAPAAAVQLGSAQQSGQWCRRQASASTGSARSRQAAASWQQRACQQQARTDDEGGAAGGAQVLHPVHHKVLCGREGGSRAGR